MFWTVFYGLWCNDLIQLLVHTWTLFSICSTARISCILYKMDPSQPSQGLNMAAYEYQPYTHTQPFLHQINEDLQGQKRHVSPESQFLQYPGDKRLRHNSMEYMLDMNSPMSQPTFIRKVTLEDVMRGIDNLAVNTVKRDDLKDIATKQDLANLEGNVKAQALELHQLKSAVNRQQNEINSLRETVDGNCAAILSSSVDRSADRGHDVGHRMLSVNGAYQPLPENTQTSKRYNMVIEGVPDLPIPEIYAFVIKLADTLDVTIYKRDIANISRIARRSSTAPGPVLVVFVQAHLRDSILRKKTDLKAIERYSKVYVNPDEPLEIRKQKAKFRRIAYLARLDGEVVSYRADSIRIGETEYKSTEMSSIPSKYIPKDSTVTKSDAPITAPTIQAPPPLNVNNIVETRENREEPMPQDPAPTNMPTSKPTGPLDPDDSGKTALRGGRICFAGGTSFLSNFFLVCFIFCNIKYKSLEKCYHHTHALMAKAWDLANEIYRETDGVELKNLSKRIPYCAEWSTLFDPKMDEMLEAKFSQNPALMDRLIRTAPYELVEASIDKKWGGGG